MPRYLLSVHDDVDAPPPTPERMEEFGRRVGELDRDLREAGAWVFGMGLAPANEASVVTADAIVTDGPYAEAREHVAGVWVIDAEDLAAAQAWAARVASAAGAPIEVRPTVGP